MGRGARGRRTSDWRRAPSNPNGGGSQAKWRDLSSGGRFDFFPGELCSFFVPKRCFALSSATGDVSSRRGRFWVVVFLFCIAAFRSWALGDELNRACFIFLNSISIYVKLSDVQKY